MGGSQTAQVADEGEDSPLSTLFRDHYPFVWRCARRLGASPGGVDDVVQDVFLVVDRRLSDFVERGAVRSWLFAITMRVVQAHRRKERRHGRRVAALADATPPATDDERRNERIDLLHRLLATLDDDKRAVFILAELEQMSAPEISAALGVPVNTVYSRLRLARKRVRAEAQREGLGETP